MLDFDRTKTKVIEFLADIKKLCKERRLSLTDKEKFSLSIEMLKVHELGILSATIERIEKKIDRDE